MTGLPARKRSIRLAMPRIRIGRRIGKPHDRRRPAASRLLAMSGAGAALVGAMLACTVDYRMANEPEGLVVRVQADQAWTDTGVDVRPGERLQIEYLRGTWSPWAGGSYDAIGSGGDPRCDCNQMAGVSHAALIGRLENGEPFFVGERWDQVVGERGRLYLGINDSRLGDNRGWLEVIIRHAG